MQGSKPAPPAAQIFHQWWKICDARRRGAVVLGAIGSVCAATLTSIRSWIGAVSPIPLIGHSLASGSRSVGVSGAVHVGEIDIREACVRVRTTSVFGKVIDVSVSWRVALYER